ncbi:OmpW family outer membrane protein [Piscinibacter sp. XHJ-5]|uniref:OmpW/AlkL family protein n=1 Tax=Piscinibacter sp. XHJ-5 TaxID=3037797 RepID=UPI0024535058|nr:OmpW family outer membrane protein [Piscinibacter sp. XHJ-5]
MRTRLPALAVALAALLATGAAAAQETSFKQNVAKFGLSDYTTNSKTNGVSGIGVPPGADAETGDATTVIAVYERLITPNLGVELVLGVPPRIKADAKGSVAFLGSDILSARNVSPTLLVLYHFGQPGDRFRPSLGAGINYTKFTDIKSRLAPKVEMSDSTGWAVQAGLDYALTKEWGLFASVAALQVKSKVVASGTTVLTSEIDFRPVVYSFGASYKF